MNLSLLLAAALCFPSAPDLWKGGPLTDEVMKLPSAPVFAPDQQLQAQVRLYRQLRSPFQRSRMAIDFSETNNPAAFRLLLNLLGSEKDSFVQDNILESLLRLQRKGYGVRMDDNILIRHFKAASPAARSAAALLYLGNRQQPDPGPVLEVFRKETSVPVLNRLLEALRPLAGKISPDRLSGLYENAPAGNIALRSLAAELLARQENADGSALLQKVLQDPNPVIRVHAARGLAANSKSGSKLLKDASLDQHPAVRLAAAGIEKPDAARTAILEKLLSDPSPAVRAAAAKSLGTAGTKTAAELLVKSLADSEIAVRRSVSDALIQLKPDQDIHKKAVETGNVFPRSRRQTLAFLVRTRDEGQEATIQRWIKESDDPLFLEEAAAALGILNCRRSGKALISLGNSKEEKIRTAAAVSMGQLKLPETFPTLAKLCRDRVIKVAEAAFMSMYQISDRSFVPEFERMTGRFSEDGANCRAIACRALTAFPLKAKVIANLNKLITTACIRVPMTGPMPDADHVRVSALLLLQEHARKGSAAAKAAYQKCLTDLSREKPGSELVSDDLEEFLRQLKAAEAGQTVKPKLIDSVKPLFRTEPAGAKK
ncbi:MAG: HEAT repeat domain-containing protein [Lentisphaeria bacterium]|nr:HEAT repeat domain-containing protein [Lentisphaeria bacterium]